jgi:hypothetical protein
LIQVFCFFVIFLGEISHFDQHLGVFACVEYFIEDLLQVSLIAERPKSFILMAKYDIFHYGTAYTHEQWNLLVHLSAVFVDAYFFTIFTRSFQHLLHFLELLFILAVHQLKRSQCENLSGFIGGKFEFDTCFGFWLIRNSWVMYECFSTVRIWRH